MDRRGFTKILACLPFIGKTTIAEEQKLEPVPSPNLQPSGTNEINTEEKDCQCCYCKDMRSPILTADISSIVISDIVQGQGCDAVPTNDNAITQDIPGIDISHYEAWENKYSTKIEETG